VKAADAGAAVAGPANPATIPPTRASVDTADTDANPIFFRRTTADDDVFMDDLLET
jgi:hypothetical protein